jgi:hypothetical protein
MPRRVSLPGASELFRPTDTTPPVETTGSAHGETESAESEQRGSGRVRHDEKITVYMSADELVDLEHARLILRRDFGLAVDRGRIVRESLNLALHGLEAGADSPLVRRLNGSP